VRGSCACPPAAAAPAEGVLVPAAADQVAVLVLVPAVDHQAAVAVLVPAAAGQRAAVPVPAVDQEAVALVPAAGQRAAVPVPAVDQEAAAREAPRTMMMMIACLTCSITTIRLPVPAAALGRLESLPRFLPSSGSCTSRHTRTHCVGCHDLDGIDHRSIFFNIDHRSY
jgi:hypothetical protein